MGNEIKCFSSKLAPISARYASPKTKKATASDGFFDITSSAKA